MSETRFPSAPAEIGTTFLSIEHAPIQLEGTLARAEGSWGAVCCHPHSLHGGNMRNKVIDTAYRVVADQGGHALRFNFRGVGDSEGSFGEGVDEAADLQGAIAHLKEETNTDWPLWLIGFSFGTRVISYMLDQTKNSDDIDGVILLAPPCGSMEMHTFPVPPLGVHCILGEEDEFCTPEQLEAFRLRFSHEKVTTHVMTDTGHFFHRKLPALAAWITSVLQTPS